MAEGRTIKLTGPMRRVEGRLGRPLAEELTDRYEVQGQNFAQIAEALGVSQATISRWMCRLGIEARFPGQRASKVA